MYLPVPGSGRKKGLSPLAIHLSSLRPEDDAVLRPRICSPVRELKYQQHRWLLRTERLYPPPKPLVVGTPRSSRGRLAVRFQSQYSKVNRPP